MSKARRLLRSGDNFSFIAMVGAVVWVVFNLVPASIWLDVQAIGVEDSTYGDPIVMHVDRTISRSFEGEYNVELRKSANREVVCNGINDIEYDPDAQLPTPLTFKWWAYGLPGCDFPIPAGKYFIVTCWNIFPHVPLMPTKRLCVDSNVFDIAEATLPHASDISVKLQQYVTKQLQTKVQGLEQQVHSLQTEMVRR